MSRRDFQGRETKKSKKGTKKPVIQEVISPPATVEVVKKHRKKEEGEE
jgi:hypothetical protein